MDSKYKVYVYDLKEMILLTLLAGVVGLFAFTTGVHFGKLVGLAERDAIVQGKTVMSEHVRGIDPADDRIPNRQEFDQQLRGARQNADEFLGKSLQEEVARTGIKLDPTRQVDLPNSLSKNGSHSERKPASKSEKKREESTVKAGSKFGVVAATYLSKQDAKDHLDALEMLGLKPSIQTHQGEFWVVVGDFSTYSEADDAGGRYKKQHIIDEYRVEVLNQ